MSTMDSDTQYVFNILKQATPELVEDARVGSRVGNSSLGCLMTRPFGPFGARQYAEAAIRRAIKVLDAEGKAKGSSK